jgi:hypothetical protein
MIKHLYQEAIDKWGADAQLDVAIEELSELIKEICKFKRGFDNGELLAEEVADVEIMCEQLRFIFDFDNKVDHFKNSKLKRLEQRLEN